MCLKRQIATGCLGAVRQLAVGAACCLMLSGDEEDK